MQTIFENDQFKSIFREIGEARKFLIKLFQSCAIIYRSSGMRLACSEYTLYKISSQISHQVFLLSMIFFFSKITLLHLYRLCDEYMIMNASASI